MMLTTCCKVAPVWVSYNRELWKSDPGPDHWKCPECEKIHPPCDILPDEEPISSGAEQVQYGKNTPEPEREWNQALDAALSAINDMAIAKKLRLSSPEEPAISIAKIETAINGVRK